MDGHAFLPVTEQVAGGALIALVLLDVFLTVLYARMGTSILTRRFARWGWHAIRAGSRPFVRARSLILAYAGPVLLITSIGTWVTRTTRWPG